MSISVRRRNEPIRRRLTTRVPTMNPSATIGEVEETLRLHHRSFDTIEYIYVVDDAGRLIGVFSVKEMYAHERGRQLSEVAKRDGLITIHPDTHQERAAYLALKYHLKAIPVVGDDGHFEGVIPSDAILAILYKETHEDLLRLAGINRRHATIDNVLQIPITLSFRHRVPWLMVGLVGGLFTSKIIGFFEDILSENLILASFIPLVVYMSGAIAVQTQTVVIRDLAIEHHFNIRRYVWRQMLVVIFISFTSAILLSLLSFVFAIPSGVALTLIISLFAAMASSIGSGLLVPFVLRHFRSDPANVSGPIVTIIQDMTTVILYFAIASVIL